MRVVFVSNYINHHQIPFCDRMNELSDGNFTFVQTEPMEEERRNMGWDVNAVNKPYVELYYEEREKCDKLIMDAECVIFGGCEDESIIRPRLVAKKFTIRYSERLYKEGRWKFVSPRGLRKKYYDHTQFKKNDVYLLCAGAYVKGDFSLVRAYTHKMLKYGYFPKTEIYDDIHELRRANQKTEILWAARLIDWKHPEMVIELARSLRDENVDFHISMIGVGDKMDEVCDLCRKYGLEDRVSLLGRKTPDEVRDFMRKADIYLATSDMKEGWGAVVNEAMNSGCVVIASNKMGATPYLIKNGVNGYSFKSGSDKDLLNKVIAAVSDKKIAYKMGESAYDTIKNLWNSDVAAKRVWDFINDSEHKMPDYEDGPVSKA